MVCWKVEELGRDLEATEIWNLYNVSEKLLCEGLRCDFAWVPWQETDHTDSEIHKDIISQKRPELRGKMAAGGWDICQSFWVLPVLPY